MKNIRFLVFILTIGTLVLSACGGAATPTTGAAAPTAAVATATVGAATPTVESGKVEAMPVAFIGTIDSMAGDQWVISGITLTVDPAVVRDGPFAVGDQVKLEAVVNPDGSFTVSRVEAPSPQDVTTLPRFGDDNSNDVNVNVNDDNSNAANSNDTNTNADNGGAGNANNNTNDDHGGGGNGGGGNDNGGGGKGGGGGNDNGGGGNGNGH